MDKKVNNRVNPIIGMLIGFILYEASALSALVGFDIVSYIKALAEIIIIFFFIQAQRNVERGPLDTPVKLFLAWTVFVLLRGSLIGRFPEFYETNVTYSSLSSIIRYHMTFENSALAMLVPFVSLCYFDSMVIKNFRKIGFICAILSVLIIILLRNSILNASMTFGAQTMIQSTTSWTGYVSMRSILGCIFLGYGVVLFLSFNYSYIKQYKLSILVLLLLILSMLLSAIGGGRGGTMTQVGYILTFFFIYSKWPINKNIASKTKTKLFAIFFLLAAVFLVVYLFKNTNTFDYLIWRAYGDEGINSDLNTSGRDFFVNALVNDFNKTPWHWLFGRGVNGYFLVDGGKRMWMEWGYLWYILKGGIVYLALYLVIFIKAFFLGIKHSNNIMSKAMGFMCLWQVLLLIPFGLPSMTVQYYLSWLFVSALNSERVRNLSDDEVLNLFKL